jgi:hypothetical protein
MDEERKAELAHLINEATQHRLSMTEALGLIDKLQAGGWLAAQDSDTAVDGPEFDAALESEIAHSEVTNQAAPEGADVPDEDPVGL